MRMNGIQGRLMLILGTAGVSVLAASTVALVALIDIRSELDLVNQRDFPIINAALGLARIGERLQYRGSAMLAADEFDSRMQQQHSIEKDMSALLTEVAKLQAISPDDQVDVGIIANVATRLTTSLLELRTQLDQKSEFAQRQARQHHTLLQAQEQVRQLLGPSILAVAAVLDQEKPGDREVYQAAVRAQGPLLSAERLVNSAIETLLLASASEQSSTVLDAQQQFTRALTQLGLLSADLPAGLQSGLKDTLKTLAGQLAIEGVFALRRGELDSLENAARLMEQISQLSVDLKNSVDRLVFTTNTAIGGITRRMGEAVTRNTLGFVAGSFAVVLLTTLLAWLLVVRPVGRSLARVTEAMTKLAAGERTVQIPAIERKDEIGELARAFTIFKDNIFRMEYLDRELSEKSNLLIATFDNMNDGLSVFDRDHRLIAWNPQFLNIYSLSSSFVESGRSIDDIHRLLDSRGARVLNGQGEKVSISTLVHYRDSETIRFELYLPDQRTIELRSNPMPSGGFVTIHMDISARLATEAQLRQAQKMEMVGQLTGGIAHDFNNILAVILGNLHVIDRELANNPLLRERTARAIGAADKASRQVERLLVFSRRQRLVPRPVDANALVAGMMDLLDYSLGPEIELSTDFSDDLPMIYVDPGQLENVLMNLAINARDALEGHGRIVFSTRLIAEPFVEIAVADNGAGMPPEVAEHIFEPFFTTKPTGKGSGLGLSMVYGIIKQSGANIQVRSQPGQGTTIVLQLPLSTVVRPADVGGIDMPRGNGEELLVVDDDTDLLAITAEQLTDLGYRVNAVSDVPGALEVLDRNPKIRLLYTDVMMPDPRNGAALATEARMRNPKLLVLYTSANPSNLIEAGAVLLNKPVSKQLLAQSIRKMLDD